MHLFTAFYKIIYGMIFQKKVVFGDGEVDGELICYIFYFVTAKKDVYLKDKI